MVELGSRRTIERVRVGNSLPNAACAVFLSQVGRALRKQCLYPEPDGENYAVLRKVLCKLERLVAGSLAPDVKGLQSSKTTSEDK